MSLQRRMLCLLDACIFRSQAHFCLRMPFSQARMCCSYACWSVTLQSNETVRSIPLTTTSLAVDGFMTRSPGRISMNNSSRHLIKLPLPNILCCCIVTLQASSGLRIQPRRSNSPSIMFGMPFGDLLSSSRSKDSVVPSFKNGRVADFLRVLAGLKTFHRSCLLVADSSM